MKLGGMNRAIEQLHFSNALHLSPAPFAILSAQTSEVMNAAARSNGFNVRQRANDFKAHLFPGEEIFNVLDLSRDARGRQALQEVLAVALRDDARVEDRKHAAISLAADQPAQALFQGDDRRRD